MTKYTVKLFYADWCPHCVRFKPHWEKFKSYIKENLKDKDIIIETEEYPDTEREEMNKENISSFPTIIIYKNGDRIIYSGKRDLDSLLDYFGIKKNNIQSGGYNNYYHKYLKYKTKYLNLKGI